MATTTVKTATAALVTAVAVGGLTGGFGLYNTGSEPARTPIATSPAEDAVSGDDLKFTADNIDYNGSQNGGQWSYEGTTFGQSTQEDSEITFVPGTVDYEHGVWYLIK